MSWEKFIGHIKELNFIGPMKIKLLEKDHIANYVKHRMGKKIIDEFQANLTVNWDF